MTRRAPQKKAQLWAHMGPQPGKLLFWRFCGSFMAVLGAIPANVVLWACILHLRALLCDGNQKTGPGASARGVQIPKKRPFWWFLAVTLRKMFFFKKKKLLSSSLVCKDVMVIISYAKVHSPACGGSTKIHPPSENPESSHPSSTWLYTAVSGVRVRPCPWVCLFAVFVGHVMLGAPWAGL